MKFIFWMIFFLFLVQCSQKKRATAAEDLESVDLNYPLPGFDLEGSDPLAIVLADRIMSAMGGREAWDKTRYIKWKFYQVLRHNYHFLYSAFLHFVHYYN